MNQTPAQRVSFGVLAAAALALALVGCARQRATAPTSEGDDTVVATYAGKQLTQGELDQKIGDELYELRQGALERIIIEDLVQMEAQKRGVSEEELLKAEIADKVPAPPEEEMRRFFEQVSPQLPPGADFEQFRDRIAASMTRPQQQQRAGQFFEELRNKADVEVKLAKPLPPKKEVAADGPAKGPANAPVTIVEFSDFQCPFCSRVKPTVQQVMEAYPGKVRVVFRHFPLDNHDLAPKAAEASLCAHDQGKFWEYHDVLFQNQNNLGPEALRQHAQTVGLQAEPFEQCLSSGKHAQKVKKDMEDGRRAGVSGTPAFFINGRMISGAQPFEEFRRLIDAELKTQG
jgi:protein-disulfide isomerase